MKIKLLILIAFVFVTIASCTKDIIEPKLAPVIPPNTSAKFSTDVYPIFANNSCTGCHGGAGGLTLTGTPSAVRANLLLSAVIPNSSVTSKLYTFFNGTSHKNKSLTTSEVSNIKGWIDSGALDN
jgi:hypothetical protein